MIKEEEKKNQVTFPKASVSGTAKVCPSLLVLTGAKRINQPSRVGLPGLPPVSSLSLSCGGPQKGTRVGVGSREWALPGEECSETRNSMAGVGLRRRI